MAVTYREAISYLDSFVNYERRPLSSSYNYRESWKLKRMRGLLQRLGSPEKRLRIFHVAGSKGKGSTCVFLACILKEAGYRVGLYTSPHLDDLRERIRVLGARQDCRDSDFAGMLARRELIRLVEFIRPAVEKYQRETSSILSFFEVYTALALVYFSQRELDCVVLETGLGGRLDATNAAQAAVCGITPISLEHTQQLGSTLSRIAREKAGIIKKGACVISAVQTPEAAQVIKDRCNRMGARLYQVGEEIMVSPQTRNINRQTFAVKGLVGQYPGLYTRLAGSYQPMNAAVAVGMAESAVKVGLRITTPAIKRGITSARWPGRMEIFRDGCFVVLDGALNVSSTLTLIESLDYYFGTPGLIVVLGLCEDKDIPGVCGIWKERARGVILTQADNPRAVPAQSLASYFSSSRILSVTRSVPRAVAWASSQVQKGEVAVVSGSLFVVAEARRYLLKRLKRNEDKQ